MSSEKYKLIKSHPHPGVYRFGESLGVGHPVSLFGNQLDGFGRIRTSQTINKLSIMQLNDAQTYLINSVSGSADGLYTYDKDTSSTELYASGSGSYIIRQTYERALYVPGNSLIVNHAFYNFQNETNCIKRIGYFTSEHDAPYDTGKDGLYFESDGVSGSYSFNLWRTGSLIERVEQADWNVDPLDGTGYTGLSMSFDRNQILQCDLQWLGVGRVRWGFIIDGVSYLAHESGFTNHPTHKGVFMNSPNQPLRWECRQNGAGSGSFRHTCASAQIEGNSQGVSKSISVNFGNTELTLPLNGTRYLIAQIRALSGEESARILETAFSFLSTTNDNYLYEVWVNATVSGTGTWIPIPNTHGEAQIGDGVRTVSQGSGVLAYSNYITSQTTETIDLGTDIIRFGTSVDGIRDRIVISVMPLSVNMKIIYAASSKVVI